MSRCFYAIQLVVVLVWASLCACTARTDTEIFPFSDSDSTDNDAASTLLFRSAFAPTVTLGPNGPGFQSISGADQGYEWSSAFLGGNFWLQQIIDSGDAMANSIVHTAGPFGSQAYALRTSVTATSFASGGATQNQPIIQPLGGGSLDPRSDRLYFRMWRRLPADLAAIMASNADSQVLWEFQTGGAGGNYGGDFRIIVRIELRSGSLLWTMVGDSAANGTVPNQTFWTAPDNTSVAVPVGEWFALEYYWDRPNGRVWTAVNGAEVFNQTGVTTYGIQSQAINRIMFDSNFGNPVTQDMTLFEVHSDLPADASVNGSAAMSTAWWQG